MKRNKISPKYGLVDADGREIKTDGIGRLEIAPISDKEQKQPLSNDEMFIDFDFNEKIRDISGNIVFDGFSLSDDEITEPEGVTEDIEYLNIKLSETKIEAAQKEISQLKEDNEILVDIVSDLRDSNKELKRTLSNYMEALLQNELKNGIKVVDLLNMAVEQRRAQVWAEDIADEIMERTENGKNGNE